MTDFDSNENFSFPAKGRYAYGESYSTLGETVIVTSKECVWPIGEHLYVTSQFGEGSEVGYKVVYFDETKATITFKRASFWERLRAYPRVFVGHYRILRAKNGRLVSFHQADTLAMMMIR